MALVILNASIKKIPIGSKVKVKDAVVSGIVTRHLDEFDTFTGKHHFMVQLNNDEFHTYYIEYVSLIK